MKSILQRGKAAYVLFAVLAVAIVVWYEGRLALHKPFWSDEGFDLVNSCLTPFGQMILHGAQGQCSRSPLFYFLHRSVIFSLGTFDQMILLWYRLPSLAGSAAGLLAFLLAVWGSLGAAPALAGFAMFINQPIYHQFAAESRPYMVWLGSFTALTCAATMIAARPFREPASRRLRIGFVVAALALTTSASPGAIELCAALASILFCWVVLDGARSPRALLRNDVLLAGSAAVLIGVYYMFASCHITDASEWDLLKTRDPRLVWSVLELLVPRGSAVTLVFNALFFAGLATPLVLIARRRTLDATARAGLALGLNMLLQLALSVLLGALVALKHHYFIQRVFIYLVACRAFLVALGLCAIMTWFLRKVPRARHAVTAAAALVVILYLAHLDRVALLHADTKTFRYEPATEACTQELDGPLRVYYRPSEHTNEFAPNFYAALGFEAARCGWKATTSTTRYLVATPGNTFVPKMPFELVTEPPSSAAGFIPMTQCGRDVLLSPPAR